MNLSNCPHCHDPIRVPTDDLAPETETECPWCQAHFPLSEALDRLPPVLRILSAGGVASHEAASPLVTAVDHHDDPDEPEFDDFELLDDEAGLNETVALDEVSKPRAESTPINPTPRPATKNSVAVTPAMSAPTVKTVRRRQSGGGLRRLIGVAAGGLLSLPIVAAILWGLGLGPFADASRPIVPAIASQPTPAPDTEPVAEAAVDDWAEQDDLVEEDDLPEDVVAEDNAAEDVVAEMIEPTEPSEPTEVMEAVELVESAELIDTVERGIKMVSAIDQLGADDPRRQDWLTKAYRTLAKTGELATFDGPALRKLLAAITTSEIVDDLATASAERTAATVPDHDGLLLIGESDGTSIALTNGRKFAVRGTLPASGRVIVIGTASGKNELTLVAVESLP
jgi:hypothetical protein